MYIFCVIFVEPVNQPQLRVMWEEQSHSWWDVRLFTVRPIPTGTVCEAGEKEVLHMSLLSLPTLEKVYEENTYIQEFADF